MPASPNVVRINDFTPGVVQFSRGATVGITNTYLPTYPPEAQVGSAASAFRCYAVPNVGLCPLPTPLSNNGALTGVTLANNGFSSIAAMKSLGKYATGQEVLAILQQCTDSTSSNTLYQLYTANAVPSTIGSVTRQRSSSEAGVQPVFYGNLELFFDHAQGMNVVYVDPYAASAGTAETVVYWSLAGGTVGTQVWTFSAGQEAFEASIIFTQSSRMVIPVDFEFVASSTVFTVYGITDPPLNLTTPITFNPNTFEPAQVLTVGAWGSMDAGELFLVGQAGGGIYVSGDVLAPSSVIKLPGVTSTGLMRGPAVSTQIGMIYLTDQGAYLWNGGNTSQKISGNIPDDALFRLSGFTYTVPTATQGQLTHHDIWGDWVMFANNWLYDTLTGSWWQIEDPSIREYDVWCSSKLSQRYAYSATGRFVNTSGGTVNNSGPSFFGWDRYNPASSYQWVSNPIAGQPGSLVVLDWVEVVVSNPTAHPATVAITPQVPTGQTPYPGNNAQTVTFTIPANSVSNRQRQQLGYTDYNVQIGVVAANTISTSEAPIIHEISVNIGPLPSAVL